MNDDDIFAEAFALADAEISDMDENDMGDGVRVRPDYTKTDLKISGLRLRHVPIGLPMRM